MKYFFGLLVLIVGLGFLASLAQRGDATSLPDQLVGQWQALGRDEATYRIRGDGRYDHASMMQSTMSGCTMQVFRYEVGLVVAEGQTLVFSPKNGTITVRDNCDPSGNSEKPINLEPTSHNWRLMNTEYGVTLCLSDSDGAKSCYRVVRDQ